MAWKDFLFGVAATLSTELLLALVIVIAAVSTKGSARQTRSDEPPRRGR